MMVLGVVLFALFLALVVWLVRAAAPSPGRSAPGEAEAWDRERLTRPRPALRQGGASQSGWSPAVRPKSSRVPSTVAADPIGTAPFILEYGDRDGVVTRRGITPSRVYRSGGTLYIEAWCTLRGAIRTFRLDRVLSLHERDGTRVPHEDWAEGRADPAPVIVSQAHRKAMTAARPGLLVLIWIASEDREIDEAEERIMLDFIEARRHVGRTPKPEAELWREDLARAFIDDAWVTRGACASALAGVVTTGREAALIRDYAERIVASSGAPEPGKERRRRSVMKLLA